LRIAYDFRIQVDAADRRAAKLLVSWQRPDSDVSDRISGSVPPQYGHGSKRRQFRSAPLDGGVGASLSMLGEEARRRSRQVTVLSKERFGTLENAETHMSDARPIRADDVDESSEESFPAK
jgi:hypothetical protein